MTNKILVVHNVDVWLLEAQRKELVGAVHMAETKRYLTPKQTQALKGVVNMLDEWADGIYHSQNPVQEVSE